MLRRHLAHKKGRSLRYILIVQDNLLFSCCCARVDFSWTPVCDCYAGGYRCEQKCLEKALVEESVYATVGTVSPLRIDWAILSSRLLKAMADLETNS